MATASAPAETLQEYVEIALDENLALKQQTFSYERARSALAEARGAFLPSIDFSARYTRAGGGRTIEVPAGDMVNPAYAALNELLGEERFPTDVPNITTSFLREEEHETKLTLTQPLVVPALYYNQASKANFFRASEAARDQYARELVAEVKSAYFKYVKAGQIVDLLIETRALLEENLRVSESLVRNDKATREVVYRAQAELSSLDQQQADADRGLDLARAYFNFLLNRPLGTEVDTSEPPATQAEPPAQVTTTQSLAVANRDELRQLDFTRQGVANVASMARTRFVPELALALEYGFEGEEYRFGADDDYWMASLVLSWNLFSGFRDRSRVRQADLEKRRLSTQLEEVQRQISLEARNAHQAVQVTARSVTAAHDRLESTLSSYRIVERKYAEGMTNQIDYLDARIRLTEAEVNLINSQQDYQIALADLERVTAGYPLSLER